MKSYFKKRTRSFKFELELTIDSFLYCILISIYIESYSWTHLFDSKSTNIQPSLRYEHASIMANRKSWVSNSTNDATQNQYNNRLVVMFGSGDDGLLNDTWAFDFGI